MCWKWKMKSKTASSARHLLLLLGMIFAACGAQSTPRPPSTPPPQQSSGPTIVLPDGFVVHVEVAADDPTREQGLMYRDRLPDDRGMIFFFPQASVYPFWMKNTLIPLDMIWIDQQKKVVYVARDVPPCKADPCPSYSPDASASYVLELAAGGAARHRVATGSVLRFKGLENIVVR